MKALTIFDADHLQREFTRYFMFKPYPEIVPFAVRLPEEHILPRGALIDIETTGLNPEADDIITMGILQKDRAVIHQLTKPSYELFKAVCESKAIRTPKPRYVYNARFESTFLNIKEGWHDLRQYAERDYEDPERGPYYRMRLDQCTFSVFKEPNIKGADVPHTWQEWLTTQKPETLSQITLHNLADLLRTRQLIEK